MKILPPALAFALGLALAAVTEPRSGGRAAASAAADLAGGLLLTVDEQGAIVDTVEAPGIADAIDAIESSGPAAMQLLILLVPVAGDARARPTL
jgi:hypothetical protein